MASLFYSEEVKESLEGFASQKEKVVTAPLLNIIESIAKIGITCFPWTSLKVLLGYLLNEAFQRYYHKAMEDRKNESDQLKLDKYKQEDHDFETRREQLLVALNNYDDAPFTLQRICELVLFPEKTYNNYRKYLSALEKMVNITSTIPMLSPAEAAAQLASDAEIPQQPQFLESDRSSNPSHPMDSFPGSMDVDTSGVAAVFPGRAQENFGAVPSSGIEHSNPTVDQNHSLHTPSENASALLEENEKATPMDML